MVDHASGEGVDLFLEEELFVDVRLRDDDLQQLAAALEQRRQAALHKAQQAEANERKARDMAAAATPLYASAAAAAAAAQPQSSSAAPVFSTVPVTVHSLRRWHEAEIRKVHGRNVCVHFLEIPLPPQWINVDEEHDRLAELHVMTTLEREGQLDRQQAVDLTVDVDELFDEVIASSDVQLVYSPAALSNGRVDQYEAALLKAKQAFLQRWFSSSSSSSSFSLSPSSSSATPVSCSDDVAMMDGDDVYSESVTVPLYDPLTQCRLMIPVRTAGCQHVHCLDLMTHLQHQKAQLQWRCTCGQDAFANLLQVDLFILHILRQLQPASATASTSSSSADCSIPHSFGEEPETRHVVISRDGSWRLDDREKRKRKREDAQTPSDSLQSSWPSSSLADSNGHPPASSSSISSSSASSPASSSSSSSRASSPPAFLLRFPVSFPSVLVDDLEYIDLRGEDTAADVQLRDWLVQRWTVKKEQQEQLRKQAGGVQPMEESKQQLQQPSPLHSPSASSSAGPPYFLPFSPSSSSRFSPQLNFPSSQHDPRLAAAGGGARVAQAGGPTLLSTPPSARHDQPPQPLAWQSPQSSPGDRVRQQLQQQIGSWRSPSQPLSASSASSSSSSVSPLSSPPSSLSNRHQVAPPAAHSLGMFSPPHHRLPHYRQQPQQTVSVQPLPTAPMLPPISTAYRSGSSSGWQPHRSSSFAFVSVPQRPAPAAAPAEPLNVNTCTEYQLKRAGFSMKISSSIVAARKEKGDAGFQSLDELLSIKGVGVKTLERLKAKLQI